MNPATLIAYAELLSRLALAGAGIMVAIQQASAEMKKMQEEGRDPTDAEWAALHNRVEALRSQL